MSLIIGHSIRRREPGVVVWIRMKKKRGQTTGVVIYQAKNGALELRGDASHETVWATQAQIAEAFEVDVRTINEHIQNIIKTKELGEKATIRNFRIVRIEGTRSVERDVRHYNLDMILSVGYRVNSKKATRFRQWATNTLREYITQGYAINRKRIAVNYEHFLETVEDIKRLLPVGMVVDNSSVLELVSVFADTWLSLDAYDKDELVSSGVTKKAVSITAEQLSVALSVLKKELVKKGEASELFGQERHAKAVEGIVGNIMQSFGGKPLYPTVEERAAHLLYFIVKNHPFSDGNKRSGAYAFVWFLKKAGILDIARMTPPALTALTLLVAESNPAHKERVVRLTLQLLKRSV